MWRLLATLTIGLGAAVPASAPEGSVEDFIDTQMSASGVPGLAYAVVSDGEVTSAGAHGVLRAGGDDDISLDTGFLTGSITKSFTALALIQLVEAGEVDLDAEISTYLDGFSGLSPGAVTVRQLLSQTSGFSTLQGNTSHTDHTGGADELERRVDRLAATTPAHRPGAQWEYSNANYLILGRLIEVVSGQDYQSYVTDNILEPVGMKHSFVADGEVHDSMATGHRSWFWTKRPMGKDAPSRGMAPAGGVVASAGDLARYLQMMMNGETDLISADDKAQMMRPASATSPSYGFGWFVDSSNSSVWHSGTSPGFETLAVMVPSERKGVVVLVNAGSGVGFGETAELLNGVAARALDLDYSGEGSRWPQKAIFIALVLLPIGYLLSMIWAWTHRGVVRAKAGSAFGLFSLWFPLFTTAAAAWVVLSMMPGLLGAPLATIRLFQPDLGLTMIATAVTGVLWALFRLGVAYTGRSGSA